MEADQINILKVVFNELNQGLDMQVLFTNSMSTWYNTNTSRFLSQSAFATLLVGPLVEPLDGVLRGLSKLWKLEGTMIAGQQHVEAIQHGQIERLEHVDSANPLSSSTANESNESTEPTGHPLSRRNTGNIAVGQSAAQEAIAAFATVFLEADADVDSGNILTEDVRQSASPVPEPADAAAESLASSPVSAASTEAEEVLSEPAFVFSWDVGEMQEFDPEFETEWIERRNVLKVWVYSKNMSPATPLMY